jgi:hypothetical protein
MGLHCIHIIPFISSKLKLKASFGFNGHDLVLSGLIILLYIGS